MWKAAAAVKDEWREGLASGGEIFLEKSFSPEPHFPKAFDWWGGRAEGFVPAVGTGEFFHPRSLRGTPWINSYSSGTAQLERLNWNALKRRVNVALMSKQSADTRIFRYTHYC